MMFHVSVEFCQTAKLEDLEWRIWSVRQRPPRWSSGATGSVEALGCLHGVRGLASLGAFMGAPAGTPGQVKKRSTCGCLARQRPHVDASTVVLEVFLTFLRCSHMRSGPSSTSPSYLARCCQSKEAFGRISPKFYVKVATRTWSSGYYFYRSLVLAVLNQTTGAFGRTFHVFLRWYVSGLTLMCTQSMLQLLFFVRAVCTWNWTLLPRAARTLQSLVRCLGVACEFSAHPAES